MPDLHTPTGMQQRRNSLRFAPFGPPTVSCVLAAARTCIRQAPPTSRGRGPATSAVLPVRSATSATLEKGMKKGGRDFRPPFLCVSINQMLFFYAADWARTCISGISLQLLFFKSSFAVIECFPILWFRLKCCHVDI